VAIAPRGDFVVDGTTSVYFTDGCSGIHRLTQGTFSDATLPSSANAPGVTLVFDATDVFYFDGANLKRLRSKSLPTPSRRRRLRGEHDDTDHHNCLPEVPPTDFAGREVLRELRERHFRRLEHV